MSAFHLPPDSLIPNTDFCRTWLNVHDVIKELVLDKKLTKLAEAIHKSKGTCYEKVEILLNYASTLIHSPSSYYPFVALLTPFVCSR